MYPNIFLEKKKKENATCQEGGPNALDLLIGELLLAGLPSSPNWLEGWPSHRVRVGLETIQKSEEVYMGEGDRATEGEVVIDFLR